MVPFETESWLWYGFVVFVVALRFTSRILHFKSFYRFQVEDYLMIFITCTYTIFIVLINICMNTNTNLIDPNDVPSLTPEDIAERTYGSKIVLGVEQTMCMVQWGTKACLLFLYYRLTENLVQNIFVKAVGIYGAATYMVMEILYLGYWCRPFSDYWKTPTDNVQCTTALNHLIVNLAFNISSDLLIMSIALPLLLRTRLEIKRKIMLCFPFTLGFFSMACAIISKYVSFTSPFSAEWGFWYTREASCIMIVCNMPYSWGLLRRVFKLKSFLGRGSRESENDRMDAGEMYYDTPMETVHGEVRELEGRAVSARDITAGNNKNQFATTWAQISTKSTPSINIEINDTSEHTTPAMTQSSASTTDEPWKNIVWTNIATEAEITQVSTRQSNVGPDTLAPPPPAVMSGPWHVRQHNPDHRRASVADSRRKSTFSSKHGRGSVSEASQRSRHSINVDAVDRLYRLDDEDLLADQEVPRPRSRLSHRGGFD